MKITTFKNMKGMIHGPDPKRIAAEVDGVLLVGTAEIPVTAGRDEILPLLYHGGTGDYGATFTDRDGRMYDLGKISIRAGRITPPSPTDAQLAELRLRLDMAEDECEALREEIRVLKNIFDTNSLNFLIKGDTQ